MKEPPSIGGAKPVLYHTSHGTDMLERIGRTVAWAVRKGEERIEMRLEPPELGPLLIKITREKDLLRATFWTENQSVKELLEAQQAEFRRILGEDGLRLERCEVFLEPDLTQMEERQGFSFRETPWQERETNEEENFRGGQSVQAPVVERPRSSSGHGRIDRIV
ncbi:MAG: flagellar hook-length control protein FliK [Desulfobacterota bacterium]|nr:flagellar hook-length control protein FliK [Thermodesulfobacteriota bacterium]